MEGLSRREAALLIMCILSLNPILHMKRHRRLHGRACSHRHLPARRGFARPLPLSPEGCHRAGILGRRCRALQHGDRDAAKAHEARRRHHARLLPTFRDWAGDATHYPRELIEQALAHTIQNKAERAYRRSAAVERRRELMEAWAVYLGVDSEAALALEHAAD